MDVTPTVTSTSLAFEQSDDETIKSFLQIPCQQEEAGILIDLQSTPDTGSEYLMLYKISKPENLVFLKRKYVIIIRQGY